MKINLDDLVGTQRDIAETIGIESYIKLCKSFGGDTIYIQKYSELQNSNATLKSKQSIMDTTAVSLQESMIYQKDM